jgi:hypothetical protein
MGVPVPMRDFYLKLREPKRFDGPAGSAQFAKSKGV